MAVVPLLSSPLATSGIFLQCKQIAAKKSVFEEQQCYQLQSKNVDLQLSYDY